MKLQAVIMLATTNRTKAVIPDTCKNRLCKTRFQENAFNLSTTDKTISVRVGFLKHVVISRLVGITDDPFPGCWSCGAACRWRLAHHNHKPVPRIITVNESIMFIHPSNRTLSQVTEMSFNNFSTVDHCMLTCCR